MEWEILAPFTNSSSSVDISSGMHSFYVPTLCRLQTSSSWMRTFYFTQPLICQNKARRRRAGYRIDE